MYGVLLPQPHRVLHIKSCVKAGQRHEQVPSVITELTRTTLRPAVPTRSAMRGADSQGRDEESKEFSISFNLGTTQVNRHQLPICTNPGRAYNDIFDFARTCDFALKVDLPRITVSILLQTKVFRCAITDRKLIAMNKKQMRLSNI